MEIKISNEIRQALVLLGYKEWTKIQKEVIPAFFAKENIVAQSKTGSGKTCAYALPICENIIWEKKAPQALILACTRELAMQIKEECELIGKYKRIKVQCVYGKENIENQKALLKQQCHIVVATPGRLLDLIEQGCINLSEIETLVIDEADYMLDLGFLEAIEKIMNVLPDNVQKALFSATYPKQIQDLIDQTFVDVKTIVIEDVAQISHYYHISEDIDHTLLEWIKTLDIESALIFCERKEQVDKLYKKLSKENIPCAHLHGDLKQKVRFEQLNLFKRGNVRILIASDVAARGIDIDKVSHVFHYGVINHKDTYIHRCGRSGRMSEKGNSFLLIQEENDFYTTLIDEFKMQEACDYIVKKENLIFDVIAKKDKSEEFKKHIEKIYINAGSEKKIRAGDIIGALCSLDGIDKEDIGVIELLRKMTYVEIYNNKATSIVEQMQNKTIKKKKVKVEIAK